jgi:periplasmic divalent cation tolerance protein
MNFGVVLVTVGSESEGVAIARSLVESNLAACVNFFPLRSLYRWQGQVYNESEYQLIIKTDLDNFALLEAKIKELHSYDVPEIIALPIVKGSQAYLDWMGEQCRGGFSYTME